jgi:RNA polymerase sigma-70 factor, ECF subfamily
MMQAALSGNETQYRLLLAEMARVLRRLARHGLARAGRGNQDAEDIVQETLLAIHLKRESWDQTRPFLAWFHAVARHKLIDSLRRQGARIQIEIGEMVDVLAAPETDITVDGDVETLVSRLPDRQQAIVRDISLRGRSISETARALGMQEGACRVALHRALKSLAAMYRSDHRED